MPKQTEQTPEQEHPVPAGWPNQHIHEQGMVITTESEVLGMARKAELFDIVVRIFEDFMDDRNIYQILRGFMTEQEIIESGVLFKYNESFDAKHETTALLEQLGGQAGTTALLSSCKFHQLFALPLTGVIYIDHCSNVVPPFCINDIATERINPDELADWEDVFNADIVRVFPGACGVHVEVSNIDPERFVDFSEAAYLDKLSAEQGQRY